MKKSIILPLATILLIKRVQALTPDSGLCLRTHKIDETSYCQICYKSLPNQQTGGCSAPLPDSDGCMFYYNHPTHTPTKSCGLCKTGYALTNQISRKCIKDPKHIKDCTLSTTTSRMTSGAASTASMASQTPKSQPAWPQAKSRITSKIAGLGRRGVGEGSLA